MNRQEAFEQWVNDMCASVPAYRSLGTVILREVFYAGWGHASARTLTVTDAHRVVRDELRRAFPERYAPSVHSGPFGAQAITGDT